MQSRCATREFPVVNYRLKLLVGMWDWTDVMNMCSIFFHKDSLYFYQKIKEDFRSEGSCKGIAAYNANNDTDKCR